MMNRKGLLTTLIPVAFRWAILGFSLVSGFVLMGRAGSLLQEIAVRTVGWLLGVFYRVHVDGLRLLLCGQNILPDQSGSSALVAFVMLVVFLWLAWIRRPGPKQAVMGFWVTLFLIYATNVVRIFILSAGSAFPNLVGHVDVSLPLWHDLISSFSILIAGLLPLGIWTRFWQNPTRFSIERKLSETHAAPAKGCQAEGRKSWCQVKIWLACSLFACALSWLNSPVSHHSGQVVRLAPEKPFSMVFQGVNLYPLSSSLTELDYFGRQDLSNEKRYVGHRLVSSCRISSRLLVLTRPEKGEYHVVRTPQKPKTRYC